MKLLFSLVTTAFFGTAGASIYYAASKNNNENKGNDQVDSKEKEKKLEGPEAKKKEKEEPDIPDSRRQAAPAESETVEILEEKPVRVVQRTIG